MLQMGIDDIKFCLGMFADNPPAPSTILFIIHSAIINYPRTYGGDRCARRNIIIDTQMHKISCCLLIVPSPKMRAVFHIAAETKFNGQLFMELLHPLTTHVRIIQRIIRPTTRLARIVNPRSRIQINGSPTSISKLGE